MILVKLLMHEDHIHTCLASLNYITLSIVILQLTISALYPSRVRQCIDLLRVVREVLIVFDKCDIKRAVTLPPRVQQARPVPKTATATTALLLHHSTTDNPWLTTDRPE